MTFNETIFENKTLSDIFSDVYKNTERKREQVNQFIASFVKLIRTPEDAAMLGPVLKDLLEVNVKNDEHIVRLAQIAQRLVSVNSKTDNGVLLSEIEKEELLKNVKIDLENVLNEAEDVQDNIDTLKSKL
jgi:signal transduction histidine kinase